MVSDFFQSILYIQKNEGLKKLPKFFLHPFYENITGYILKGTLKDAVPPIPPQIPVIIREAVPEDKYKFQSIIPPIRARLFARKMADGESCAVAILEDEVIDFTWASFTGQTTSKDMPFELGQKDVYIWGAYCLPKFRQHGIHTSVASFHEYFLRIRGYETSYRFTKFNNEPYLKLCKKLGVKIVGMVHVVRILGYRIFRYQLNPLE